MTKRKLTTNDVRAFIQQNPDALKNEAARRNLLFFAKRLLLNFEVTNFHKSYYYIADKFAHGELKKLIIQAPPQHGKQLKDSTLTPTPNGFRRHGDLKPGDYVFGKDGKAVRVLAVSPKTLTEYRVTFGDGSVFDCHGNHEWVVYDRNTKRERIIETRYLASCKLYAGEQGKRGCHYRFKVEQGATINFEQKIVSIDAYTLGAWLGDGKTDWPMIHIGGGDIQIINNIPYETKEGKGTTDRVFYIHGLTSQFKKYGLLGNKHIPDDYIYNSIECRKQLIAGLIDTDGYVYHKNGRVTISNTNKKIIDGAALILRSLGQSVAVSSFAPQVSSSGIIGRQIVYQLCFNPTIEFPTVVPRKQIRRTITNRKRAIVNIELLPENEREQGNCIEVEGGIYLIGETFIPTHNSQCSSRLLPAFMLGLNPDLKICIASYAATIARDFNRDVQRLIDNAEYAQIFPETKLNSSNVVTTTNYLRNSECFEIIGHGGSLRVVGRGGSLTSKTVDCMIYDDLYKDAAEANSPVVRAGAWQWYTKVAKTRLHNEAQELIVFTRWHKDDIIGKIIDSENVIEARSMADIEKAKETNSWLLVNFEAIKTGEPTELDNRKEGEALWPKRHSIERLKDQRRIDPVGFECLFQGRPNNAEGRLYNGFKTWIDKTEFGQYIRSGCYVDVADEGNDFLCGITYDIFKSNNQYFNEQTKHFEPIMYALVTDVVYTDENTDVTAVTVPEMVNRNGTQKMWIESNNGGAIFEKTIRNKVKCQCVPFYQGGNKESRIVTAAPIVNNQLIMPFGWQDRFPKFYEHMTNFLRNFTANEHDDCADAATGVIEKELMNNNTQPYNHAVRGVIRRN